MYYHKEYIRPRYEETDQMGVIYHGNYIIWFEQARSGFFRSLNYPYSKLEKEGIWIPVIEVNCKYFNPARYDEEVYVKISLEEFKGVRLKLKYEVYNVEDEKLLVTGFSRHAVTNHEMVPVSLKKKSREMYDIIIGCLEE